MEYLYLRYREREWLYQVVTLVISAIFWHTIYLLVIRPAAASTLALQAMQDAVEDTAAQTIHWGSQLAVVIKDYEQEACLIVAFWALFIILFKLGEIKNTDRLFHVAGRRGQGNFVETQTGSVILPEAADMQKYRAIFEYTESDGNGGNALYRVVSSCLNRFFTTAKIADATDSMEQSCTAEAERLDSGLGIVRYLVWVIPSLGFIGTVRGIGQALGKAEQAVQGNIAPVTESLGTAFNSTLVALVISVAIMFLLHKLQEKQEVLMLNIQRFCDENVLRYLQEKKN